MSRAALAALAGATLVAPASALAVEPKEEAALVSGIEEPAQHADDGGRDFANVLLFVPRHVADFLFWGTSVAVAVLENQQVVPRVQGFVSTPGGRLAVLPTLFVETGGVFSVGARMIADLGPVATGLRLGSVGFIRSRSSRAWRSGSMFPCRPSTSRASTSRTTTSSTSASARCRSATRATASCRDNEARRRSTSRSASAGSSATPYGVDRHAAR